MSSDEFETDSEDAPMPLTAADLQKARAELSECMDPREFRRRVHGLDTVRKFNDNKYKFLREAWVLAELSKHKSFVRIRLGEDPPDGYVQTENGDVLKIEITSVQTPERALGTEYSDKKKPKEYDPIEDAEVFAKVLEDAIKKKVNEQNRGCVLVVDQNIVNAIITPDKKENAIVCIKGKYAPNSRTFGFFGTTKFSNARRRWRRSSRAGGAKASAHSRWRINESGTAVWRSSHDAIFRSA